MHEAEFERIDRILPRPVIQFLPVDAFVAGGVRDWQAAGLGPLERDEADVAVADRCLAEKVEGGSWDGVYRCVDGSSLSVGV